MKRRFQNLQDERHTRDRKILLNVAAAAELAHELLHSSGASVNVLSLSDIPISIVGSAAEVSTKMARCMACTAELESVETITLRRQEELLEEPEEANIRNETSRENADSPTHNVKVTNADSVKMSVKQNSILTLFEEHLRALQATVDTNVERMVRMDEVMTMIRKLF